MIRIIEYGALTATRGGIESYIRNQVACLSEGKNKKEIQFDFLVPNEDEKLAYEDELNVYGCKFYRAYRRWKDSFFGHYVDLFHFFKQHHKEYDIAAANYLDLQNINFLIVAKLFGLKTIAHAHNSNVKRNFKYKLLVAFNRVLAVFFIDYLFTCSSVAAQWMFGELLLKLKNRHYEQINNRIDAEKFRFSLDKREKMRKKLNISSDTVVIGQTGRMTPQKNPLFIVDIFYEFQKMYKKTCLILIGDGELKEKIIDRINHYGIGKKVMIPGSQNNISDWLQAFDVFLFPSLYEGLPVSLVEAQAAGLKCFVSDAVPHQSFITDLCYTYSLKQKPREWAQAIYDEIPYNRQDMQKEIFQKGFDVNGLREYYIDLYKKIQTSE